MPTNIKDWISSIVAVLIVFIEPINYWLTTNGVFNWKIFIASLLAALIAYATGKNSDLTTKTKGQVDEQIALKVATSPKVEEK